MTQQNQRWPVSSGKMGYNRASPLLRLVYLGIYSLFMKNPDDVLCEDNFSTFRGMIVGESIETLTLEKTRNAVRELIKLTPVAATVRRGEEWIAVSLNEVTKEDIVLVRPGERIPVDGVVTKGDAAVNEAPITGESMPVDKTAGALVFAGTISESGALEIRVAKVGADTTLGQIIRVVKAAQDNKGTTQRIADKFAGYFTPIILILAAAVYLLTGELIRAVTILVIACPCALVLAR